MTGRLFLLRERKRVMDSAALTKPSDEVGIGDVLSAENFPAAAAGFLSLLFFPPSTSISKKPRWALAGARFLQGEETRGLFRCTKGRAATGRCVTVRRSSSANVSGEHRSARRRCDKQGWTRMSWNAALYARGATTGHTEPFKQLSGIHEQFLRNPAKGRISPFNKKWFIRGEEKMVKTKPDTQDEWHEDRTTTNSAILGSIRNHRQWFPHSSLPK